MCQRTGINDKCSLNADLCNLMVTTLAIIGIFLRLVQGDATPLARDAVIEIEQNDVLVISLNATISGCALPCEGATFHIAGVPTSGELFNVNRISGELLQGSKFESPSVVKEQNIVYFVPTVNTFGQPDPEFSWYVEHEGSVSNTARVVLVVGQDADPPFVGGAGDALFFDGLDDYALARLDAFPVEQGTITLWMKSSRARAKQTVVSVFSAGNRIIELKDVMNLQLFWGDDSASELRSIDVGDGAWHHIAVTWQDGGAISIIVDAEPVHSEPLGVSLSMSSEVELVLGQRLVCAGTSERDRKKREAKAAFEAETNTSSSADCAPSLGVCVVDEPTAGCDMYVENRVVDTVLSWMDANDVLQRFSDPEAATVQPGPWTCTFDSRLCVHGRAAVMEAFACSCTAGCMEPTFAFSGFIDEFRLYSFAKTASQLVLDMFFVIPPRLSGLGLGRTQQHWEGLMVHWTMEGDSGLVEPAQAGTTMGPALLLGGEQDHLAPQRIGSTAPLIGSHQTTQEAFDGRTVTLIKLHMHSASTDIRVLRARVLEPIPLFGSLYTAEFNARAGFSVGTPILLGLTILPPAWEVEAPFGEETCVQGSCTRDGYYAFYIPQQVAEVTTDNLHLEASSSPFLDDTGAPIPVIAVASKVEIKSIQLPIAVSWTEEIQENTPKVVYIPVITLSDRAYTAQIDTPPSSGSSGLDQSSDIGGLYHLIEVSCDVEQVRASPIESGCRDVGAVHLYCADDAFTNLEVESADGLERWGFTDIEESVKYVTCTDLDVYNGKPVLHGFNDTADLCTSFINETTQCVFHLNATCACPHPNRCLEPFITPHSKQLLDYRLKPDPTYSVLAALTSNMHLLTWLLGLGSSISPIAMELAAAAGNTDMVNLLLSKAAPWTKHAVVAANKRMHTDIATTLQHARSDPSSGYVEAQPPNDGRCFVRGPKMHKSLPHPKFFDIKDPEFRVIYIPPPFESGNNIPFVYSVTRAGSFQEFTRFSATGTMQVIPTRSPALVEPLTVDLNAGQRVVFFRLGVTNPDGGQSRARIVSFPDKGRLFNTIPEIGVDGTPKQPTMLGPEIATSEHVIAQLPVAILNSSVSINATGPNATAVDFELFEVLPGPWQGELNLPAVGTCICSIKAIREEADAAPAFNATRDSCVARGAFERMCGDLGTHEVVLRYARKVFPTEVKISSWMPASTRMRVLARMPDHEQQVWTSMEQVRRERWRTELRGSGVVEERRWDGMRSEPDRVSAVVRGCAGEFTELWSGEVQDALVDDGVIEPPVPALFATDTLYIQVCGLAGSGIGATDGGNVLEGLTAVELTGADGGLPKGLVLHPDNWIAYWRDEAAPSVADIGGMDNFSYGGFEPFGEGREHREEDTAMVTMLLPPQWTPPLATWRHVVVAEGGNVTIEAASETARLFVFTAWPHNGTLLVAGTAQSDDSLTSVECSGAMIQGVPIQLSAMQRLAFAATSAGAGKGYASMEYVECVDSSGLTTPRVVQVSVWCGPNHRLNELMHRCEPCPPGAWSYAFSGVERCELCPSGSSTRQQSSNDGTLSSHRIDGTECWACNLGAFAPRPGSVSCTRCQPGSYSNQTGSLTCQECLLGTFGADSGASFCKECGASSFAPMRGLSACIRCPNNTITRSMTSHSLAQCECSSESYHKTAMQGQACEPCPEGAYCPGGVLAPVTRTGYWTDSTIWPDNTTVRMGMCGYRGIRGVCVGYPDVQLQTIMQRCLYQAVPGVCDRWPDDVRMLPGDAAGGIVDIAFGSHVMERARSVSTLNDSLLSFYGRTRLVVDAARCSEGYKGRFCSDCNGTHYRGFDGYCVECPVWGNFITYMAWFGVFTALSGMLLSLALSDSHVGLILICFYQCLHLVSEFQLNWPPRLLYILRATGLSNINLHMLPWKCFGIPLTWLDVWFLSLFGPTILVVISSTLWLLPWIVTTKYYFAARNYVLRGRVWLQEQFQRWKERYRQRSKQSNSAPPSNAMPAEGNVAKPPSGAADPSDRLSGSHFGAPDADSENENTNPSEAARQGSTEEGEPMHERNEPGQPDVPEEITETEGRKRGTLSSVAAFLSRLLGKVRPGPRRSAAKQQREEQPVDVDAANGVGGGEGFAESAPEARGPEDGERVEEVGAEPGDGSDEDESDGGGSTPDDLDIARTGSGETEDEELGETRTAGLDGETSNAEEGVRAAEDGAGMQSSEEDEQTAEEKEKKRKTKKKKRRKVKSTATLSAEHLRQACFDTAFCNVLGLLSFLLIQTTSRFLEIFSCDYWNPDLSTLAAFPEMTCGALEFSTDSVTDTAESVSDQAISGTEITQDAGQRPVGGMSMAVLLYLPHLFIVLCGGNLHIAFRLRKSGRSLVDVGHRFSWRYKFLVGPFESGFWWWNVVVTARKLVIAFCQATMRRQPHLQIFFTSLALCLNLLGTVVLRPYKLERCNVLEVLSLLTLLVIVLIGAMNPLDITLVDDSLAMENDRSMTFACFAVLVAFVSYSVWLLLRDVKVRQPGPPKWFRLLRLPAKIVFQILARVSKLVLAISQFVARCMRRNKVHAEEEEEGVRDKVRGPAWTRHKFAVRRQLYSLERTLKDEVDFDPKSSKLMKLEVEIKDALDRSLDLLKDEFQQTFEKLYDDETILACLTEEVAEEREVLQQQQQELEMLRKRNALLQAKLEIQVRRQDVPDHIRKMREETAETLRRMELQVVDKEDELYELEMKLLDTLDP